MPPSMIRHAERESGRCRRSRRGVDGPFCVGRAVNFEQEQATKRLGRRRKCDGSDRGCGPRQVVARWRIAPGHAGGISASTITVSRDLRGRRRARPRRDRAPDNPPVIGEVPHTGRSTLPRTASSAQGEPCPFACNGARRAAGGEAGKDRSPRARAWRRHPAHGCRQDGVVEVVAGVLQVAVLLNEAIADPQCRHRACPGSRKEKSSPAVLGDVAPHRQAGGPRRSGVMKFGLGRRG